MNGRTQKPSQSALTNEASGVSYRTLNDPTSSRPSYFATDDDIEQKSRPPGEVPLQYESLMSKDTESFTKYYRIHNFDPELEFSPVSYRRSLLNFLNTVVGTTVLAMPYVMEQIGLSAPLVMIFIVGCIYQSMVFMLDSYHEDGDRSETQLRFYFWHATTATCGNWGTHLMATCIRATFIMLVGLGLVVSSTSMNSVLEIGNTNWIFIFCGIIILEFVLFPDLKRLSWAGSINIFNTLVCCIVIAIISIDQMPGSPSLWRSFKSYTFFDVEGFFLASNILVLSFSTSLLLPNIYIEMEKKKRANTMLFWGHLIPLLGKMAFMVSVFFVHQGHTEELAILNVDNSILRTILAVCIVVDKLVTIPLYLYPNRCELHGFLRNQIEADVWKKYEQNRIMRGIISIAEGTVLLIPSVILTLIVPNYWHYSVLISCIISTPLTFIIPNIQWVVLTKRKPIWKLLAALVLCLLGIVIAIGGLFFLWKDLAQVS